MSRVRRALTIAAAAGALALPAAPALAVPANHVGALESIGPSGPFRLGVSGFAHVIGGGPPIDVQVLVNDVVRATVTADRARPPGRFDGFAARLFAPTQPARVCARTVPPAGFDGVALGCLPVQHGIPVQIVEHGARWPQGYRLEPLIVDARGNIVDRFDDLLPIRDGVATYAGPPLPQGLFWALVIEEGGADGRLLMRTGPLATMPGPADSETSVPVVRLFRNLTPVSFHLNGLEGAPDVLLARLRRLPRGVRVDGATLEVRQSVGTVVESVSVEGAVRGPFHDEPFVYERRVLVVPSADLVRPHPILRPFFEGGVVVEGGVGLGRYAQALDSAILDGVAASYDVALRRLAERERQRLGVEIPPTTISARFLEASPPDLVTVDGLIWGSVTRPVVAARPRRR